MVYLMKVGDVQRFPGKGSAIAGVNAELDSLADGEIRRRIGSRVLLKCEGSDIAEDVIDTFISTSLGGGKNVFIIIRDEDLSIPIGTPVYAVD